MIGGGATLAELRDSLKVDRRNGPAAEGLPGRPASVATCGPSSTTTVPVDLVDVAKLCEYLNCSVGDLFETVR
jgi:hypothetical protein